MKARIGGKRWVKPGYTGPTSGRRFRRNVQERSDRSQQLRDVERYIARAQTATYGKIHCPLSSALRSRALRSPSSEDRCFCTRTSCVEKPLRSGNTYLFGDGTCALRKRGSLKLSIPLQERAVLYVGTAATMQPGMIENLMSQISDDCIVLQLVVFAVNWPAVVSCGCTEIAPQ